MKHSPSRDKAILPRGFLITIGVIAVVGFVVIKVFGL